MTGGSTENQQGGGGLSETGKAVPTGGGEYLGGRSVLQGGDSGDLAVWFIVLGEVRRNGAGYGGIPHGVFK